MNILVFNAGSSTVKYGLIDAAAETAWCGGLVERIGAGTSAASEAAAEFRQACVAPDHPSALELILSHLKPLWKRQELPPAEAIAHRIVHGGERFRAPTVVDTALVEALGSLQVLAPLHNPPALRLLESCREHFSRLPQVAVFDTAFHATLPERAWRYAVPETWYRDAGVRR